MTKESGRGGVRRGCLVGKWNKRMKCGYTPSVWLVFPASYFHLLPPSASFWCGKTVLPLLSRDFPLATTAAAVAAAAILIPAGFPLSEEMSDEIVLWLWILFEFHQTSTQKPSGNGGKCAAGRTKHSFKYTDNVSTKLVLLLVFYPVPRVLLFPTFPHQHFSSSAHSRWRHQMKMRNSYPITSSGLCVCRFPLVHRQYRQK